MFRILVNIFYIARTNWTKIVIITVQIIYSLNFCRIVVWPLVVWSRQRYPRVGREWPRCVFHIWTWHSRSIPKTTRPRSHLQSAPGIITNSTTSLSLYSYLLFCCVGGRGWVWIFCEEATSYAIFCAKLLRRIWQRWSDDERGRDTNVLVPGNSTALLFCGNMD